MNIVTRAAHSALIATDARRQCRVPYLSRERVLDLQLRKAGSMLRHAYENVPFYQTAMKRIGMTPADLGSIEDLARLPLVDPSFVKSNLDEFLPNGLDKNKCLMMATSKGRKTYWDAQVYWRRLARVERETAAWTCHTGRRYGLRQLHVFTPASASMACRQYWNRTTLVPAWVSRKFYLDPLAPYSAAAAELDRLRPDVVFSYGSYMQHFFSYLVQENKCPRLPAVWYYGADMVAPGWRERIESEFGCKVYSAYAATEVGRIGFECELGCGFHIHEDVMAVRIVDEAGADVPDGQTGEIVISCLYNPATVLLNYRIGDLGSLTREVCACGRSFARIMGLRGRTSETIELADGRKVTTGDFLGWFREDIQELLKFHILATGQGRLVWQLVAPAGLDRERMRRVILDKCSTVFGALAHPSVEFVDDIAPEASGKFPLSVSEQANAGSTGEQH